MTILLYVASYIFIGAVLGTLFFKVLDRKWEDEVAAFCSVWGGLVWPLTFVILLGVWAGSKLIKKEITKKSDRQ